MPTTTTTATISVVTELASRSALRRDHVISRPLTVIRCSIEVCFASFCRPTEHRSVGRLVSGVLGVLELVLFEESKDRFAIPFQRDFNRNNFFLISCSFPY